MYRGFSLIELVLVMAILAVLFSIGMPRYADALARYRASLAARRVVADMAYAQSEARRTSSSRTVSFDAGDNAYNIAGVADFKTNATNYVVILSDEPFQATITSVTFDAAAIPDPLNEVVFDGYGMPDSGGGLNITSGGVSLRVVLDPDTGRASVE